MPIVVTNYDPGWPLTFQRLRESIWPAIADVALSIEHVGSTSVPGLAAKPVIDMTIVVSEPSRIPQVISRLEELGYRHRGDLGVTGREAFAAPADAPQHHLYACVQGCLALRNHLAVRDRLRRDSAAAAEYGRLKKELAERFAEDIEAYIDGKTELILSLLRDDGFGIGELNSIHAINSLPSDEGRADDHR